MAADYTQTCALDEKGYRTKSKRMPGKQRNIAKPARYFIKAFAVAASDAPLRGYVYNISMYGGKGDGAENPDGAKVDYVMRSLPSSMDNDNIAVVLDSYYGGETVLQRLRERGIDGMMTVGASAVSHLFEKRDNGKVYQTGKKAGQKKLDAALEKGEFRNAVANVRDPHPHAAPGATMEVYFMRFKDKGEFGTLSSYIRQEALVTCKRTATEEKHDDSGVVTQRKGAKVEVDLPCQVSYCLLVTTYYLLLITYYLLLTTYYLLLTANSSCGSGSAPGLQRQHGSLHRRCAGLRQGAGGAVQARTGRDTNRRRHFCRGCDRQDIPIGATPPCSMRWSLG